VWGSSVDLGHLSTNEADARFFAAIDAAPLGAEIAFAEAGVGLGAFWGRTLRGRRGMRNGGSSHRGGTGVRGRGVSIGVE